MITTIAIVAVIVASYLLGFAAAGAMRAEKAARQQRTANAIDNADLQCAKSAVKRLRPTQLAAIGLVARHPAFWPGLMAFCRMHHAETEVARKHKRAA